MTDRTNKRRAPFKKFENDNSVESDKVEGDLRLNRFIARAGICSRRKADDLIFAGKVKVNGKLEENPATRVAPTDEVEVNGTILQRQDHVYILLNKGRNTITSTNDDRGRKTVMDTLPEKYHSQGLFPVGRLDRNTEGVLLITNDGELAHRLMHPSHEVSKVYRVTTDRPVTPVDLEKLKSGVELEDGPASADRVTHVNGIPNITAIEIHEGRNRQVRRMYKALGYDVTSLERVYYAGLNTRGLKRGRWRTLETREIKQLKKKVGLKDVSAPSKKRRTHRRS